MVRSLKGGRQKTKTSCWASAGCVLLTPVVIGCHCCGAHALDVKYCLPRLCAFRESSQRNKGNWAVPWRDAITLNGKLRCGRCAVDALKLGLSTVRFQSCRILPGSIAHPSFYNRES